MKQCTDYFQCKGLTSGGTPFYVNIPGTNPYSAPCNPKSCPARGKSKAASAPDILLDRSIAFPRDSGGGSGCGGGSTGGSIDPNYKTGSSGDGSASQYVTGTAALAYAVGFENEPAATLPAAQVVVTDQLDPAKLDLSTLTSFGNSRTFCARAVTVP